MSKFKRNIIMEMEELAGIVFAYGMGNIHRENQEKRITVTYSFNSEITSSKDLLAGARAELESIVASLNIPSGIAVEVIHEEDQLKDFYKLIGIAFLLRLPQFLMKLEVLGRERSQ